MSDSVENVKRDFSRLKKGTARLRAISEKKPPREAASCTTVSPAIRQLGNLLATDSCMQRRGQLRRPTHQSNQYASI